VAVCRVRGGYIFEQCHETSHRSGYTGGKPGRSRFVPFSIVFSASCRQGSMDPAILVLSSASSVQVYLKFRQPNRSLTKMCSGSLNLT
jgi:hypothetical protein